MVADDPFSSSAGVMEGSAALFCDQGSYDVTATLYWWSGSSWNFQSNDTASSSNGGEAFATAIHGCTRGETHMWKTNASGTVDFDGVLYSLDPVNTPSDESVRCLD
jgi:hypothetical protein